MEHSARPVSPRSRAIRQPASPPRRNGTIDSVSFIERMGQLISCEIQFRVLLSEKTGVRTGTCIVWMAPLPLYAIQLPGGKPPCLGGETGGYTASTAQPSLNAMFLPETLHLRSGTTMASTYQGPSAPHPLFSHGGFSQLKLASGSSASRKQ